MKTSAELKKIRDDVKKQMDTQNNPNAEIRIAVGMATCGIAAGAKPVLAAFIDECEKRGLKNVKVIKTGCIGMCHYEPIVDVFIPGQEKVTYVFVSDSKAREIVASHIIFNKPIAEYMFK